MTIPMVTTTGSVTSESLENAKLLGQSFLEVLDEMGDATVRFFGEERSEFVEGEFEKIPEGLREILYVPAWAFFNASYLVGRPAVDGAEAAGTGAAMMYNAANNSDLASEEFWMGVSGLLAGTGAVVGTFAIAASAKPPITLTSIPTDISTTVSASAGRGAMAPALAVSVSTTVVPAVSTEAAAASAVGALTGPTVMCATAKTEGSEDTASVGKKPSPELEPEVEQFFERIEETVAEKQYTFDHGPSGGESVFTTEFLTEAERSRYIAIGEVTAEVMREATLRQRSVMPGVPDIIFESNKLFNEISTRLSSQGYSLDPFQMVSLYRQIELVVRIHNQSFERTGVNVGFGLLD